MASKRHQRRRSCENKLAHTDPNKALGIAKFMTARHKTTYRVYKCKFCGRWHVGRPSHRQAFGKGNR